MLSRTVTVYGLVKPHRLVLELPILLGFNLLLIGCAQLTIDLPLVPITAQTFGVLVIGMALGSKRGSAVMAAYLIEGVSGLPVFAGGHAGPGVLLGPTGGYLIGFLGAAWVTGRLAEKNWDRSYLMSLLAMTAGTVIIFACGIVWLATFVPSDSLLAVGLFPFIPGAILKIAFASLVLPSVWRFLRPGR